MLTVQFANCVFSVACVFKFYESCNTNRSACDGCRRDWVYQSDVYAHRSQEAAPTYSSVSSTVSHTCSACCQRTLRATHTLLSLPYLVNYNRKQVRGWLASEALQRLQPHTSSSRSRSLIPTSKPPTHNLAMLYNQEWRCASAVLQNTKSHGGTIQDQHCSHSCFCPPLFLLMQASDS